MAAFLGWLLDGFELGLFPVVARPALQDMLGNGLEGGVGVSGLMVRSLEAC